jgi:hypothetical protein
MKLRSVGAELLRADVQTDMTKLIVAFLNFAKAPKTEHVMSSWATDDHTTVTQSKQNVNSGLD